MARWTIAAALALWVTLAGSPAATAKPCPDHPSNTNNGEVDEYAEFVPGDCGDKPFDPSGGGSGGGGSGVEGSSGQGLSNETAAELSELGPDGDATAAIAESTAPEGAGTAAGGGGDQADAGSGDAGADGSSGSGVGNDSADGSVISGLVQASSGSPDTAGGSGAVLPVALGVSLVGAVAFALRRRLTRD